MRSAAPCVREEGAAEGGGDDRRAASRRRVLRLTGAVLAAPGVAGAGALLARAGTVALVTGAVATQALASPADEPLPELSGELPGARVQGRGRLRFFGLNVYDVRLWSGERRVRPADWAATPMALEIRYARTLYGRLIAERSLEEMRRQAEIAPATGERWLEAMKRLFPDVREGDRLTGIKRPGESARFFANGRFVGEIRDAEFARLFFGIWLSERTSEPSLRDALLGSGS